MSQRNFSAAVPVLLVWRPLRRAAALGEGVMRRHQQKPFFSGCGTVALFIIGSFACLVMVAVTMAVLEQPYPRQTPVPGAAAKANRRCDTENALRRAAREAVRDNLHYPNNASFGWYTSASINPEETMAAVRGTVTARNGFGADLTYDYFVLFAQIDDEWTPTSVAIEP